MYSHTATLRKLMGCLVRLSSSCSSELLLSFSATRDTSTPLLMITTSRPLTLSFIIIIIISNNCADRKIYFACCVCSSFSLNTLGQLYIRMLLWCVRMVYNSNLLCSSTRIHAVLCTSCMCMYTGQQQLGFLRMCIYNHSILCACVRNFMYHS